MRLLHEHHVNPVGFPRVRLHFRVRGMGRRLFALDYDPHELFVLIPRRGSSMQKAPAHGRAENLFDSPEWDVSPRSDDEGHRDDAAPPR